MTSEENRSPQKAGRRATICAAVYGATFCTLASAIIGAIQGLPNHPNPHYDGAIWGAMAGVIFWGIPGAILGVMISNIRQRKRG